MLSISIVLFCLAAAGTAAMAAKYGLGPVPADYHGKILENDGKPPSENAIRVLRSIYRIMAGALLALALTLAALALIPISQDALWAKLVAFFAGGLVAAPSLLMAYRLEQETGVRTPWRIVLVIIALLIAAFVTSLL